MKNEICFGFRSFSSWSAVVLRAFHKRSALEIHSHSVWCYFNHHHIANSLYINSNHACDFRVKQQIPFCHIKSNFLFFSRRLLYVRRTKLRWDGERDHNFMFMWMKPANWFGFQRKCFVEYCHNDSRERTARHKKTRPRIERINAREHCTFVALMGNREMGWTKFIFKNIPGRSDGAEEKHHHKTPSRERNCLIEP